MKIIAIRRDGRFSPNCLEKDRAILEAASREACKHFEEKGEPCQFRWIDERDLKPSDEAEIYLSMARLPEALSVLEAFERKGRRVVNRPNGVRNCQRSRLQRLMLDNDLPMPDSSFVFPVWLKRGDGAAQSECDVVFCADETAFQQAMNAFEQRGVADYVVSRHVAGDVVKFYGVGDHFFRYFYPTDDGDTKFGDEMRHNGPTQHYAFDAEQMKNDVNRLAGLTGLEVYGGDCIVRPDGSYCIIDFNDWPSFSRCRDEAAKAIVQLAIYN